MKGHNIFHRYPLFNKPLFLLGLIFMLMALAEHGVYGQATTESPTPDAAAAVQVRIERARALAAAHQLDPAVNELESIRTSSQDEVVRNVTSVMLMSICLEEGNYARAQALLEETFRARSIKKDASIRTYFALAGQAVNGARAHVARYRTFGINVTDAGLPAEALGDLDRLRSLLERMIAQAKEIARDEPKAYESFALLEDVLGIRLSLARDDEERGKWENEYAGARRGLVTAETQVASLGGVPPLTAPNQTPQQQPATTNSDQSVKPPLPAKGEPSSANNTSQPGTLTTGSLNTRAISKVVPSYPQMARAAATQGVVRVYVTVDETGKVVDISRSEGPALLKGAAEDAARRWRFPATQVDGKTVRVTGFIDFNFTL